MSENGGLVKEIARSSPWAAAVVLIFGMQVYSVNSIASEMRVHISESEQRIVKALDRLTGSLETFSKGMQDLTFELRTLRRVPPASSATG